MHGKAARSLAGMLALLFLLSLSGSNPAAAAGKPLLFAAPGIPPIFADLVVLVAEKGGFFKKYGADVEVRQFDSGAAGSRAVLSGDADFALGPAILVINQISNADAPFVAIYGMPNPDFVLGSTDPKRTSCKDLIGQPVGVDTPGGQRWLMLKAMLMSCGVNIDQVQQVSLGSNTGPAMLAGQLTFGVLHIDDVSVLDTQGKPVSIITTIKKAAPDTYNILGIVRRDRLAQNREGFVRLVAGLIAAAQYVADPKNADKVAADAAPTGRNLAESKEALKGYLANGEWPITSDELDRGRLEATIAEQVKIGAIKPGKTPVTYDRLVDRSIWRDAAALVEKQKG